MQNSKPQPQTPDQLELSEEELRSAVEQEASVNKQRLGQAITADKNLATKIKSSTVSGVGPDTLEISPEELNKLSPTFKIKPPKLDLIPSQSEGVTIDLSDFLKSKTSPSPQNISQRIYQSLGFSDQEALDYATEKGVDPTSAFYSGNDSTSGEYLKNLAKGDQATMGRVQIPELHPGAISETRQWLLNHRVNQNQIKEESQREGSNFVISKLVNALTGVDLPRLPKFATEGIADVSSGLEGSLGSAIQGTGHGAEWLRDKLGYEERNSRLTPLGQGMRDEAGELSRLGGAPDGIRKDIGQGIGATIPALAAGNPINVGMLSMLESSGQGDDFKTSLRKGLISGAAVKLMGLAGGGIAKLGEEGLVGGMGRFGARALANTLIPPTVNLPFERPNQRSLINNAIFGTAFAVHPHPRPEAEPNLALKERLLLPAVGETSTSRGTEPFISGQAGIAGPDIFKSGVPVREGQILPQEEAARQSPGSFVARLGPDGQPIYVESKGRTPLQLPSKGETNPSSSGRRFISNEGARPTIIPTPADIIPSRKGEGSFTKTQTYELEPERDLAKPESGAGPAVPTEPEGDLPKLPKDKKPPSRFSIGVERLGHESGWFQDQDSKIWYRTEAQGSVIINRENGKLYRIWKSGEIEPLGDAPEGSPFSKSGQSYPVKQIQNKSLQLKEKTPLQLGNGTDPTSKPSNPLNRLIEGEISQAQNETFKGEEVRGLTSKEEIEANKKRLPSDMVAVGPPPDALQRAERFIKESKSTSLTPKQDILENAIPKGVSKEEVRESPQVTRMREVVVAHKTQTRPETDLETTTNQRLGEILSNPQRHSQRLVQDAKIEAKYRESLPLKEKLKLGPLSGEGGAISLELLGIPQVMKAWQASKDLVKRIPELETFDKAKGVLNSIRGLVNPALGDPKGETTKLYARERMAQRDLDRDRAYEAVKQIGDHFKSGIRISNGDLTPEMRDLLQQGIVPPRLAYGLDFAFRIQSNKNQLSPELEGFAKVAKEQFNDRLDKLKEVGKDIPDQWYEDYFPQLWSNETKAKSFYSEFMTKQPLAGSAGGAFKQRKFPTLIDGLKAGLKPAFDNPAEVMLTRIAQLDHFIFGNRLANDVQTDSSLGGRWKPLSERMPEGYSKVDDRLFKQFAAPTRRGAIQQTQEFVAPTPVVNVLHRVMEKSLFAGGGIAPALRGLRNLNNSMVQLKLGLSPFHFFFVGQDAPSFKLAKAIEQVGSRDFSGALKSLMEVPKSPLDYWKNGSKIMEEATKPGSSGSEEIQEIVQLLTSGGARFKQHSDYATNFHEKMMESYKEGLNAVQNGDLLHAATRIPGVIGRAPFALVEWAGKPIMEYEVPMMKLGVKMELMKGEMERLGPEASRLDVIKASAKVNDIVDAAMGQLAYDNLFWHPAVRGIAQLVTQSVGWNIGTVKAVGGGIKDILSQAPKIVSKPSEIEISLRAAYVGGMVAMTALVNSITQALLTKHYTGAIIPPTGEDFFAPRSGRRDDQGREERYTNPSYVKDVLHFFKDPISTVSGKKSPLFAAFIEQMQNRDWQNVEVTPSSFNPLDKEKFNPIGALKDRGENVLQKYMPISFSNLLKERQREDVEQKFPNPPFPNSLAESLPMMGITRAASSLTNSPMQSFMSEELTGQHEDRPRTKEEFERGRIKSTTSRLFREGKGDQASRILQDSLEKGIISEEDITPIIKNSMEPDSIKRNFRSIERFDGALTAFSRADPQEREKVKILMMEKYLDELKKWTASPEKVKEIQQKAIKVGLFN